MPSFKIKGRNFNNPVELCLHQIGGKWKIPTLWRLREKVLRYGELKKAIPKCTHQVLAVQLKELEKDGYVHRKVYAIVPPKVEYTLTEKGKKAMPVIDSIRNWGLVLMKEFHIDVEEYLKSR